MSTSKDKNTPDSAEESAEPNPVDDTSTTEDEAKSTAKKPKKASAEKAKDGDAESGQRKGEQKKGATRRGARPQPVPGMNPSWWAPVMCTLMIVGLLWIVVFYLLSNGTKDTWPIPGIGYGNLAIGFGMIMAGFLMTTRWK